MAKLAGDDLYYVVTDHIGTPREIFSEDGKRPVWRAKFGRWGNEEKIDIWKAEAACNIRFQGQWADEESGLHYNRFRHYDAEAGQYLSRDPIGLQGGPRPQAYVVGPNGWVDRLGLVGCSNINFDQILDGNINGRGQGSGGHYTRSGNVRVVEYTAPADRNGVRTGVVEMRDPQTGGWDDCIQVASQTIYTQDANVSARAANPRSFPLRASITAPGTLPSLHHKIRSIQNPRLQIAFIDVEEYLRMDIPTELTRHSQ
ncbi:RHS repeat-associated core domain-containing protein [Yoonia sp. R2-816]|uniref:RHS repeat-associated core domain-containing protein n=1 Tax=Yoonia sp. R2-816 TaxID=3342638 RepID=UPI00372AAAA8